MWQWFVSYNIWILAGSAFFLTVLLIGRETLRTLLYRVIPAGVKTALDKILPALFWITASVLALVIATAIVAVILSEEGITASITPESIQLWLLEHGMPILLVVIISFLMYKLTALAIPKLVEKYIQIRAKGRHSKLWYQNRSQTLSTVMITTLGALILVIAVFTVLSEIGIDITPLLAGAGVAGIAVGFGAQNLIKDLLSGLFILLEDQYNKGDVVEVAGREGTVEEINLRRTVLRDLDGVVYSIPNGEISTTSNYTRDWSRVKLDVPVGYGEDLDRVFEVLNQVGKDLAADKAFSSKIKTPPQVLRVQRFSDSSVDVRMLGDVKPSEQWTVTGELRKRVKKAFDEQGIEIPWPRVKVYFGQEQGSKTVAACPHCSKPTDTTALFCSNCGAALVPGEDKKPGV